MEHNKNTGQVPVGAALTYCQLSRTARLLKDHTEQMAQPFCAEHGLTTAQLRVLIALHLGGRQTASGLAEMAGMAGANASTVSRALEDKTLITRKRAADDERSVYVGLSAEGRRLMAEFDEVVSAAFSLLEHRVKKADLELITKALDTLNDLLENGLPACACGMCEINTSSPSKEEHDER